ncbi:COX15/CtaA family protein [Rheinheimera sp. MMS21-TC3]|uniref:COX15/CtaA family protein n=1 Tax=Rheinheimera sp. MMS21-TC3 TaxID=3072790 RepID=UPI0028C3E7BC|nr:COX15/CtaA family protein [Rheinheimera sp. MMS21-TC3]WNO59804.1 COX15/CtaA family protein [Rheinheimera sp. MMS21-TC3]
MTRQRWLAGFAIILTLGVITLGAYTRLTDAGLGCPDWPGCYGFLKVPQQEHHIAQAMQAFPDRPVHAEKAWNEMIHRYFAGTLGLLIAFIFISSWWRSAKPKLLPSILVVLVIFQAALGMWTVTLNLLPLVVMGHLLGGFAILSLLALYWLKHQPKLPAQPELIGLKPLANFAVILLIVQIALGGWTAANYAALACIELPICEPGWLQRMDLVAAFDLHLGHDDYEYGVMSAEARQTVHILHRFGALITVSVLAIFLWQLWQRAIQPRVRKLTLIAAILLACQFCLGLMNVVLHLPLANAVAHNVVAANLLMVLVLLLVQVPSLGSTRSNHAEHK